MYMEMMVPSRLRAKVNSPDLVKGLPTSAKADDLDAVIIIGAVEPNLENQHVPKRYGGPGPFYQHLVICNSRFLFVTISCRANLTCFPFLRWEV